MTVEDLPGPPASLFRSLALPHPRWAPARGRGVRIAVVDSGVNPDNPHVGRVEERLALDAYGEEGGDVTDRLGHGTAVVAAIQEKAPEASILVLKVFGDTLSTTALALARAIERATELDARLINLSLGTPRTGSRELLGEAVSRARAAGALVVSPREHRGRRWWPGSFPGVAGVLLDHGCPRHELRLMEGPDGEPVFRASGYPRPVLGLPPERNLRGISFAAANVTGLLARVLEGRRDAATVEDVARLIREDETDPSTG